MIDFDKSSFFSKIIIIISITLIFCHNVIAQSSNDIENQKQEYYKTIKLFSQKIDVVRIVDCAIVVNVYAMSLKGENQSTANLLKLTKIFRKAYNDMTLEHPSNVVQKISSTSNHRIGVSGTVEQMKFLQSCMVGEELKILMHATYRKMQLDGNAP